jgi:hypothetical protein
MAKQKILVALLCGAGFSSLLLLLLNVSQSVFLTVPLSIFLLPGFILADLMLRSNEFGPPLFVFAANSLVYAVVAYAGVSVFGRGVTPDKIRLATIRLAIPVAILVCLACVPRFNPLWPRGMTELARQERVLQEAFPVGMGIDAARAVLRSKGIRFYEWIETSQAVVLERQDTSVTAAAGDRVISARIETEAGQFPCGYDVEVVLLFGPNDRLKDQYVHRLRLCP